jgi:hypothetical protein
MMPKVKIETAEKVARIFLERERTAYSMRSGQSYEFDEFSVTRLAQVILRARDNGVRAHWQPIATRPFVDDLMWFASRNGKGEWIIEGPRGASSDDDRFELWAECDAPSLPLESKEENK